VKRSPQGRSRETLIKNQGQHKGNIAELFGTGGESGPSGQGRERDAQSDGIA